MITKAIITSVPIKGQNLYGVRIPLFEQAGVNPSIKNKSNYFATLCFIPGLQYNFNVGDIVFVGFENNEYSNVVILGKLFLPTDNDATGVINASLITVSGAAQLPTRTSIGDYPLDNLDTVIDNINSTINTLNSNKQDTLISGKTIKTINGNSLLGEGDLEIK